MKELNELIKDLDFLPNNDERKKYLYSIRSNPNLGRHELKRLACNILIDYNFVEEYYRLSFKESLKKHSKKITSFFIRLSVNKVFL